MSFTFTWTQKTGTGLPASKDNLCAVMNGDIYVVIGDSPDSTDIKSVYKSTDNGDTFSKLTSSYDDFTRFKNYYNAKLVALNDTLYLIGGGINNQANPNERSQVWSSTDGATWTKLIENGDPINVDGHVEFPYQAISGCIEACFTFGGKIYIIDLPYYHAHIGDVFQVYSSSDGENWDTDDTLDFERYFTVHQGGANEYIFGLGQLVTQSIYSGTDGTNLSEVLADIGLTDVRSSYVTWGFIGNKYYISGFDNDVPDYTFFTLRSDDGSTWESGTSSYFGGDYYYDHGICSSSTSVFIVGGTSEIDGTTTTYDNKVWMGTPANRVTLKSIDVKTGAEVETDLFNVTADTDRAAGSASLESTFSGVAPMKRGNSGVVGWVRGTIGGVNQSHFVASRTSGTNHYLTYPSITVPRSPGGPDLPMVFGVCPLRGTGNRFAAAVGDPSVQTEHLLVFTEDANPANGFAQTAYKTYSDALWTDAPTACIDVQQMPYDDDEIVVLIGNIPSAIDTYGTHILGHYDWNYPKVSAPRLAILDSTFAISSTTAKGTGVANGFCLDDDGYIYVTGRGVMSSANTNVIEKYHKDDLSTIVASVAWNSDGIGSGLTAATCNIVNPTFDGRYITVQDHDRYRTLVYVYSKNLEFVRSIEVADDDYWTGGDTGHDYKWANETSDDVGSNLRWRSNKRCCLWYPNHY